MPKRRPPTKLKKPSVYPDKQSGRFICDFHELQDGVIRQRRIKFDKEAQANKEAKKQNAIRLKAKRIGKGALSDAELEVARWMFSEIQRLPWSGITVADVVEHFKSTYNPAGKTLLSEAIKIFEKEKKASGIKASSFKDVPPRLEQLNKRFGGCKVGELSSADFITHIEDQTDGMKYKIYSLVQEFLTSMSHAGRPDPIFDPKIVSEIEYAGRKGKKYKLSNNAAPTILHIDEVRNALKTALTFKVGDGVPGEWLGSFVLGTFCGLRPAEIQALGRVQRGEPALKEEGVRWSKPSAEESKKGKSKVWEKHIQLNRGVIVCDETITTKTDERRSVQIRPNVLEWLSYIKSQGLPICPGDNRYGRKRKYFKIAIMGLERQRDKKWDDVFRHTFATFLNDDKEVTDRKYCGQLGHSRDVAKKSYLGDLHDNETSEEFFSIRPTDECFQS